MTHAELLAQRRRATKTNGKKPRPETVDDSSVAAETPPNPLVVPDYFHSKTFAMRGLGLVLLIVHAPVIAATMLIVRLTSRGPALFKQERVGKDGETFLIYKIRTMVSDAEDRTGPVLCQPRDARVTPVGRVLRFLHLDELPQLLNVVRGEMCLVGPRPERPEIIERNGLNEKVPGFSDRTKVLPGVTGLAQINLPADQTADCVVPKVRLDREYIQTANMGLDLRILACTAFRMLGVRHGRAVRLFHLQRDASSPLSPPRVQRRAQRGRFDGVKRLAPWKQTPSLAGAGSQRRADVSHSAPLGMEPAGMDDDPRYDPESATVPRKPR